MICKDIKEVCVAIKNFAAILNNDLKAVTGVPEDIDKQSGLVIDNVNKLQSIQNDIFSAENKQEWDNSFKTFEAQISEIETSTIKLIDETFERKLNSSLHAFELLENFKHIETRVKIQACLEQKFTNVLKRYK